MDDLSTLQVIVGGGGGAANARIQKLFSRCSILLIVVCSVAEEHYHEYFLHILSSFIYIFFCSALQLLCCAHKQYYKIV